MLYLISIFFIAWEMLCCRFLVGTFSEKRKYKSPVITEAIFLAFIISVSLVSFGIRSSLSLRLFISIMVSTAFIYAMFDEKLLKILTLVVLYYGIDASWDNFFYLIVGPFPDYPEVIYYAIMALSRVITLVTVLFIRYKLGKSTRIRLSSGEWLGLLSVPLITLFSGGAIAIKMVNISDGRFLTWIALGMVAINIIIFILIDSIFKREKVIRDDKVLHEKTKNELNMYKSISENLDTQRKWIHEFRNYLSCINELAINKQYDELEAYTTKVDGELTEIADMVDTHNVIVNAIINTKYREAMKKGIVFVLKVSDLSDMTLSDMDVVTILSNLLNNAFEACELCDNKVIKLKFVIEDNRSVISVKNTYKTKPVVINGIYITTKTDNTSDHGFGLKNVCDVIEKNNGKYVIDFDDKEFSVSIVI